jgi:FAD/FMN-containing dehydrogenase
MVARSSYKWPTLFFLWTFRLSQASDRSEAGSAIESFAANLRGQVLLANSQQYDSTRRVWNASFDRKPALIGRCTGASDVQQAVGFAREHGLLTAVRAGGHSYSGKSSCDGGLTIDLQLMQGVRVDPETKRA